MDLEPFYHEESKEKQRQSPGQPKKGEEKVPQVKKREQQARDKAAKKAKTNAHYVSDMKKIKKEEPKIFAQMKAGELKLKEAKQEIKEQKKQVVVEQIKREPKPLPDGPFRVQAINPPWKYESRAEDKTHRARNPYPDMTVDEIKALPVGEKAHPEGCILWLWTTNAFMRQAFECLDAWGFENKTIRPGSRTRWARATGCAVKRSTA